MMTGKQVADGSDSAVSPEQLARWFLLAALAHLRRENWQQVSDSDLEAQLEDALVAEFVADSSARRSLLTVLRDQRFLQRLPEFARHRDPARGILADSTLAYERACQLLERHKLVSTGGRQTDGPAGESRAASQAPESIVQRRAARRAVARSAGPELHPLPRGKSDDRQSQMSDEEYARLEEALSQAPQEPLPPASRFALNEERISLLAGLLAGLLLFVLVWWFLL
jgi:hypothetical protein